MPFRARSIASTAGQVLLHRHLLDEEALRPNHDDGRGERYVCDAPESGGIVSSEKESLSGDLIVGAVGLLLGPISEPLAAKLVDQLRAEHARNASKAIRAAERITGLSREDLQERIADDPRLVPLFVRVLFSAGMTGYDEVLEAMGVALGRAIMAPSYVDDAEVLLTAMSDLRAHHVRVLRAVLQEPPTRQVEGQEPQKMSWGVKTLAVATGLSVDITSLCVAGLVNAGLVLTDGDVYGGPGYYISELGKTVLAVVQARNGNPA